MSTINCCITPVTEIFVLHIAKNFLTPALHEYMEVQLLPIGNLHYTNVGYIPNNVQLLTIYTCVEVMYVMVDHHIRYLKHIFSKTVQGYLYFTAQKLLALA